MKPKIRERKLGRERAVGLYHSDGLIEIDPREKGEQRIDVLLHELLHAYEGKLKKRQIAEICEHLKEHHSFPEWLVDALCTYQARNLYANRVRVIDSDK